MSRAERMSGARPAHLLFMYDRGMNLKLYSASWCRDCREAKRFLEANQIPYTEVDIEASAAAAAELLAHVGKRAIPQFVLNGKWIQPYRPGEGFLYEEMSELFGLSALKAVKRR
jgi:mycoredoxin